MKPKVSVDVRVDPSTKARWQAVADAEGLTVGGLVRRRMQETPRVLPSHNIDAALAAIEKENAARAAFDLDADELQPLRSWFDLRDSDGKVDSELLADWRAYADTHRIEFDDLLERVAVDANSELLV